MRETTEGGRVQDRVRLGFLFTCEVIGRLSYLHVAGKLYVCDQLLVPHYNQMKTYHSITHIRENTTMEKKTTKH